MPADLAARGMASQGGVGGGSDNNFSDYYKDKLDGIQSGAQVNTVSPGDLENLEAVLTNIVYVDKDSTKTSTPDGSIYNPYKTIQEAVNEAPFGSVIKIAPGEYIGDIVFSNKQNITLLTEGVSGQYRTVVNGILTINSDSYRIGVKNISFNSRIDIKSNTGLCYFENIACRGFNVESTFAGYIRINANSEIMGDININSESTGIIDIKESQLEDNGTVKLNSGTLTLTGVDYVTLNHSGGVCVARGGTYFAKNSTQSDAIISTANTANDALYLLDGSTLSLDGSWGRINKTGTCPWMTAMFVHAGTKDASSHGGVQDILSGPRIDGGLHGEDIYSHVLVEGFIPSNNTLDGYFIGISQALKESLGISEEDYNIITDNNGLYSPEIKFSHEWYVELDNPKSSDIADVDGSIYNPFFYTRSAYSSSSDGDVIYISPGKDNGYFIIDSVKNVLIKGAGIDKTYFTSTFNINSLTRNVYFKDFTLSGNTTALITPIANINENVNISFENVKFDRNISISNSSNGLTFKNCIFAKTVDVSTWTIDSNIYFINCEFGINSLVKLDLSGTFTSKTNWYFYNCKNLTLNHNKMNVYIDKNTSISTNNQQLDYAIISTANQEESGSVFSGLYLINGTSLQKVENSDLYYYKINKSGDCNYSIGNFDHDLTNDIFNGDRIPVGNIIGDNILINETPVNYVPTNEYLDGHLKGIDSKLSSGIQEAPIDGKSYVRKDGTWSEGYNKSEIDSMIISDIQNIPDTAIITSEDTGYSGSSNLLYYGGIVLTNEDSIVRICGMGTSESGTNSGAINQVGGANYDAPNSEYGLGFNLNPALYYVSSAYDRDTDTIFIFGGRTDTEYVLSCKKIKSNENQWTDISPLPDTGEQANSIHMLPYSVNGYFYLYDNRTSTKTLRKYNISSDVWETVFENTTDVTTLSALSKMFYDKNTNTLYSLSSQNPSRLVSYVLDSGDTQWTLESNICPLRTSDGGQPIIQTDSGTYVFLGYRGINEIYYFDYTTKEWYYNGSVDGNGIVNISRPMGYNRLETKDYFLMRCQDYTTPSTPIYINRFYKYKLNTDKLITVLYPGDELNTSESDFITFDGTIIPRNTNYVATTKTLIKLNPKGQGCSGAWIKRI